MALTVIDINPGGQSSFPMELTEFDGELYFSAFTEEAGRQLYKLSPDSSTPTAIDISPILGVHAGSRFDFTEVRGELYFAGRTEEFGPEGLYRLSAGSTTPTLVPGPAPGPFGELSEFNGDLYISTGFGEVYALSPHDLTATRIDITTSAESVFPIAFAQTRHELYLRTFAGETGVELYLLSADNATSTLIDINSGAESSFPVGFTEVKGDLYFSADTQEAGRELYWLPDGSTTPILVDINPGVASSSPAEFTAFRGELYFSAFTEETGTELYLLAAHSPAPTLIDINPGILGSSPSDFFML
jgi:ELWxxDGT repeat protein